jgi:ketosteroid isomerase-like protein
MSNAHLLIREYYQAFNERRFPDAADLFADDAVVQHRPDGDQGRGPQGYLASVESTLKIFPDLIQRILHVEQRGDTIAEVDVSATGTHQGDWNMGALGILKATGTVMTIRLRELLEIRGGKITYSSITYNLQEFFHKRGEPR